MLKGIDKSFKVCYSVILTLRKVDNLLSGTLIHSGWLNNYVMDIIK